MKIHPTPIDKHEIEHLFCQRVTKSIKSANLEAINTAHILAID